MTRFEVKKGSKVYMQGELYEPPSKNLLREILEAGYTPYINGKRVTRASIQLRKREKA